MFEEIFNRLKGCWNTLTNTHKFIGQPYNNCPCYDKYGNMIGFWSRSNAVTLCAFVQDRNGETYILASQRGEGTPDPEFRGCWNVVTGYLDKNEFLGGVNNFNSTATDIKDYGEVFFREGNACYRECFEETGVKIDSPIQFWGYNDNPFADKRQNVTFRFITILQHSREYYEKQFSHKNNELNEVGEIRFINVKDVDNYKWAFNHNILIKKALAAITRLDGTLSIG